MQKANIAQKRRRIHDRIIKFNNLASCFTAGTQLADCSAPSQAMDDPGFCNEEKSDSTNEDERKRVFWKVEEVNMDEEDVLCWKLT